MLNKRLRRAAVAVGGGALLLLPMPALPSRPALPSPPVVPSALPTALPTSLPTLPVLPTSLPTVLPTALPTVLPTVLPTAPPTASATPPAARPSAAPQGQPATRPVAGRDTGIGGTVPFPIGLIASGPVGQALAVAMLLLPLLLGIWLLLMARTVNAAAIYRSAALRLNVAADLGIRPRELAAMTPESLMRVRDEVAVDELTGVLRRAAGIAALERELARARRRKHALTVAFVDVDGLKRLNDTLGHRAGDALLHDVADVLHSRLRADDVIFRYGGDEFVCVLAESGLHNANAIFEEMLATARARGRSFSYGLTLAEPGDDAVAVLGRADQQLYLGRLQREAAGQQIEWREGRRRTITA